MLAAARFVQHVLHLKQNSIYTINKTPCGSPLFEHIFAFLHHRITLTLLLGFACHTLASRPRSEETKHVTQAD